MFLVDSILVGVSLLCLGANLGSGEFTYDYGTYQSIYKVIPNKLTLADARAACLASGDGWDIGGAYTPAGNTALWNNVIKVSPVLNYFSAYCPSFVGWSGGTFVWSGGRQKGKVISRLKLTYLLVIRQLGQCPTRRLPLWSTCCTTAFIYSAKSRWKVGQHIPNPMHRHKPCQLRCSL